jgi:hypothetical protein
MSQTVPVDVVSRSYWAYVAAAIADGLAKILEGEAATLIPTAVYSDAREFFRLALDATGDAIPKNPSASIANYIIAAEAVRAVQHAQADRATMRAYLQNYRAFLERLQSHGTVPAEDVGLATELKDFFFQLQQEAEAESYDRVVQYEGPKDRLGLR